MLKIGTTTLPLAGWALDPRKPDAGRAYRLSAIRQLVQDYDLAAVELTLQVNRESMKKMDTKTLIEKRVHTYYWDNKYNCAITTLKILSERFKLDLHSQVIDSAVGVAGAGGYRAQCGLVEGALMFLGILGRTLNHTDKEIAHHCQEYARQFEARFGSLSCRDLRPEGFLPDQPPHLCEPLSRQALALDIEFVSRLLDE